MIQAILNLENNTCVLVTDSRVAYSASELVLTDDALKLVVAPGISKTVPLADETVMNLLKEIETTTLVLMSDTGPVSMKSLEVRRTYNA